jgi:TonB family protein
MKRILLLPCLLLLIATRVAAQSENKPLPWKRYTVKREEFSVMLPAHPAMATRKPLVMRLGKERQLRILGAYAEGLAFTISSTENSSPRESLDDFIGQEIFTHSGWDRSSEQEITLNGFKGRQYLSPNKIPGTMQVFATRNHIYRFDVFGATLADARVKHFFSSIVLGKTEGIDVTDGAGVPYKSDASTATQTTENALTIKEVDRRPFVAMKPEPAYTQEARSNQLEGIVLLKVIFSADGTVTNIKVASGLPYGLEDQAIEAAKRIKFIPAVKDGKFVSTWMQLEYHFNLY